MSWGRPYGGVYETPHGLVTMWRKGQRVRFFNEAGAQVGPEQPNVAPAKAFANAQGWLPTDPRLRSLYTMAQIREPHLFPLRPGQEVFVAFPDEVQRAVVVERGLGDYNVKQRVADPYVVRTETDEWVASRNMLHTDPLAAAAHSERLHRKLVED